MRVIIPLLLIITMLTSPLLQGVSHAQAEDEAEVKSLTEALGVERVSEDTNKQPNPSNMLQQSVNKSCGSGNTVDDDDQDGTSNYVERCLGTDTYNFDSDLDGITDTIEIEGISYNSQTWYLNPLRVDSNFDGLSDFHELTAVYGGIAPNIDQDNDGIPNIWDNDNDNDNVLDKHDLDPFSVTTYQDTFSLATTLEQSTFAGYQYIEIQVQPQDAEHLRYSATPLDWPTDDEGTIKDLDSSADDIGLSPYLKVTTIGRPNDDLMSAYGITFSFLGYVGSGWQPISNRNYELFIPLNPLSDGGQITAFQGKIAYEPDTIDSIAWTDMVTVALATQTELGMAGLDDLANVNGASFVFNLANIPVATSRSLKTYNLQHNGDSWAEVTDVALWTAVAKRYGDFTAILAELQTLYPDLTETELFAVIYGFTNAWAAGQTAVIQLDGVTLVDETADDSAIFDYYDVDSATNAVAYLIEANGLGLEGAGLISINPDSYYTYLRERSFLTFNNVGLTAAKQVVMIYLSYTSIVGMSKYLKIVNLGGQIDVLSPHLNGIQYWDDWLKEVGLAVSGFKTGEDLVNSKFVSAKVGKLIYRNSAKLAKAFTVIGVVMSVVGLGFELYTIWNSYLEYSSPYGYERDFALAFAVVRTVVAIVLFVLAFTGVGAFILFIFAIVGLVVSAIAWAFGEEFDLTSFLIEGLIKVFWNVEAYTRFLDFDFEGLESEVNEGLIQGATISFSDEFTGIIYRHEGDNNSQLDRSTSYGYFSADADSGVTVSAHHSAEECTIDDYYVTDGYWYGPYQECQNNLYADFTFGNAGSNIDLSLLYKVVADTRYEECTVGFCSDETDNMVLPDELDDDDQWDAVTLTFDILPDSVEALWNWSLLKNPDKDGDDLANSAQMESAVVDSDSDGLANRYDWDSDNDGLSDGFEKNSYGEVGANALLQDSDGDGLTDGQEHQLGTIINDADSDDSSPWAYLWNLPDEGVVMVTAVAYDVVGNASTPFNVQVTVDSLAPVITSDLPPNITISAGEAYSNVIELTGTVTDNYAGLERIQLRYNEQPWRTIWMTDTAPLNTTWNGRWQLPSITTGAQGEHKLYLRAYDTYGNIGYLEQTVFVDILPPTSDLTNRTFLQETAPHVAINDPIALYGVANDAGHNPLPAGPIDLQGDLHSISDATIWLQPDTYADDDAGATVSWIGDFNGDRLGDFAVGLPAAADGAGKVVIVAGGAGDWAIPNVGELEFISDHKPSQAMGAVG